MRAALVLVFAFVAVQPAQACHRFQRWRYPWPQQCGTKFVPRPAVQTPKDDVAERVTIEITVTSELLETWARQDALDKMKGKLK